jgi:competence CoiA-like predicted nuclease
MKYALVNNVITEASSGEIGICRNCQSKVRGYVGEKQVAHWRHLSSSNCDSWFENETKWHRDWKNNFPSNWQETIIERDNEKHIADVCNPYKNLVIEFQNSSIDAHTLRIREAFYGKMLWVVNTEPYRNHIILEDTIPQKTIDKIIQREESKYHYLIDDYKQIVNDLLSLASEQL